MASDPKSDERGVYKGPLTEIEADPSVTVEEFLKEARERYTLARNADNEDREDSGALQRARFQYRFSRGR